MCVTVTQCEAIGCGAVAAIGCGPGCCISSRLIRLVGCVLFLRRELIRLIHLAVLRREAFLLVSLILSILSVLGILGILSILLILSILSILTIRLVLSILCILSITVLWVQVMCSWCRPCTRGCTPAPIAARRTTG